MELLRGLTLKRLYEFRLDAARSIFKQKQSFNGCDSGPEFGSDEEDYEIMNKYELLELGI